MRTMGWRMRGFRAGAVVLLLAGAASAQGVSDNGSPFPSQVGGFAFRSTPAQFSERCAKAGGAVTASSPMYGDHGASCTVVPEPPIALPTPTLVAAEGCGGSVCILDLVWGHASPVSAAEILRTVSTKYGSQPLTAGTVDLATLTASCAAGVKGKTTRTSWLFNSGRSKDGAYLLSGSLFFMAWCAGPGDLHVDLEYENDVGTSQRLKKANANF